MRERKREGGVGKGEERSHVSSIHLFQRKTGQRQRQSFQAGKGRKIHLPHWKGGEWARPVSERDRTEYYNRGKSMVYHFSDMVSTTSWICEKKKNYLRLRGQCNVLMRFGSPKEVKEGSKGILGD